MRTRSLGLLSVAPLLIAMTAAALGQTVLQPLPSKVVRGRVVIEGAKPATPAPAPASPRPRASADTLPATISDTEFWRMITEYSEPNGTYPYENFVSNERNQQMIIPALKQATRPGEVYIGVAPEQNFTYAAALQAKMAFVVDIRRQNMLEHLLYKALFELSPTRADFAARLFSRRRPAGLDEKTSVSAMFAAFEGVKPDAAFQTENIDAVKRSFRTHNFQLSGEDILRIEYVYQVFSRGGPGITYEFASASPTNSAPSYSQIMNMSDESGHNWSYLASEETFRYVREMQRKNLIVPLVGNFAGPTAIRSIAKYLKDHNANVSAFYASNVETYLNEKETRDFYANLLALPSDASTTIIRYVDYTHTPELPWWNSSLSFVQAVSPMSDLVGLSNGGAMPAYKDVLSRIKDPSPGGASSARFVLPGSLGPGKPFINLAINAEVGGGFQIAVPLGSIQIGAPAGLSPGYAVKSMTYGSADLLKESMNVTAADNKELVITLTNASAGR